MTDRTEEPPRDTTLPKQSQREASGAHERERLEPGLNAEGTGGAGAEPGHRKGHDNSST